MYKQFTHSTIQNLQSGNFLNGIKSSGTPVNFHFHLNKVSK